MAHQIHRAHPFQGTDFGTVAAEELVGLNELTAEEFGTALSFIPKTARLLLGHLHNYDPGSVARRCEPLFVVFLMRLGVAATEVARQVQDYALLLELWELLRQEELRRLQACPLGVLVGMIFRHQEAEAFEVLKTTYFGKRVRGTIRTALRNIPTGISPAKEEVEAEIDAELNLAISEEVARFARMPRREFYVRVIDDDPALRYLPASIYRNAQDLLARLKAEKRMLPRGWRLESLHAPLQDSTEEEDPLTVGDVVRDEKSPDPSERAHMARSLETIRRHLGDLTAKVVAAYLRPGPPPTVAEVAEGIGCDESTVKRILKRLRTHPWIRAWLLNFPP